MSIGLMTVVFSQVRLRPSAKLLLLKLADHANDDGLAWPSIARLERECCIARNTVRGILDEFRDAGAIELVEAETGRHPRVWRVRVDVAAAVWPLASKVSPTQGDDPARGSATDPLEIPRGSATDPLQDDAAEIRGSATDPLEIPRGSIDDARGSIDEPLGVNSFDPEPLEPSNNLGARATLATAPDAAAASPPDGGGGRTGNDPETGPPDDPGDRPRPIGAHWLACQEALRAAVGDLDWRTWLRGSADEGLPLLICEFDDGRTMRLAATTAFIADHVARTFGATLDSITGRTVELFKFDETDRRMRREKLAAAARLANNPPAQKGRAA